MGFIEDYLACKGNFDCYVKVYHDSSEYEKQEAYDVLVKRCGCDPDMAYDVTEVGGVKGWLFYSFGKAGVKAFGKKADGKFIDVDEIKKSWETQ